jgi:hypothetical protein
MHVERSLLDNIKTKQLGIDTSNEWKREDCRKKLRNGIHREEENEVGLNLSGRKGLRGLMGEKGLMKEDWNDRNNWRKKII